MNKKAFLVQNGFKIEVPAISQIYNKETMDFELNKDFLEIMKKTGYDYFKLENILTNGYDAFCEQNEDSMIVVSADNFEIIIERV